MHPRESVHESFERLYGTPPPLVVRAPGRVNLIGEHTDYNGGLVLPMAIDRAIWIALRPRRDSLVRVSSLDFEAEGEFDLTHLAKGKHGWIEYLKGVAWALGEEGIHLSGWEGVIAGDVPRGAGLSSSAALEMATARAFLAASNAELDPKRMALLGQKAENVWVGVQCGIMDQMISAIGREDHALLINCQTLETRSLPLPPGAIVVVLDTATRRGLESSAYNDRFASCQAAARHCGVKFLCDMDSEQFAGCGAGLDDTTLRRARHVVSENERTQKATRAMEQGDAETFGQLMSESHVSLRDDFEVSCPELNTMVEAAHRQPACFGARMTGAGFGGCAVALVEENAAEEFVEAVTAQYARATGLSPALYVCQAAAGAGIVA